MILSLLMVLTAASARADAVRLNDGAVVYGTVVKTDADAVEIRVPKDQFDADDWEKARAVAHPGLFVLRDGSVLRATDATLSDDGADLRIARTRIAAVDFGAAAPAASAPAVAAPAAPAAPAASSVPAPLAPAPGLPPTVPGFPPSDALRPAAESPNSVGADAGIFIPLSHLSIQGSDVIAGPGYAFGAQFYHRVLPPLEFGFGLEDVSGSSHQSTQVISEGVTTSSVRSLMGMALARATLDEGRSRLRLLAGVGFASTNIDVDVAPASGFTWQDTHTTETRTFVDSTRTSAAFMLRPEVDERFSDSVWVGGGLAYYAIASTTYGSSAAGQAFGLNGVAGAVTGLSFFADLNVKF